MTDRNVDPMVSLLMRRDMIELISTLVAKLERISYDMSRQSIFRTQWTKILFQQCVDRMLQTKGSFDIDQWYKKIASTAKTTKEVPAYLANQPIEINWVAHLIQLELDFAELTDRNAIESLSNKDNASIMMILYNMLDLEDSVQSKLAEYCKTESQYDFKGVNMATKNPENTKLLTATAEELFKYYKTE